MKETEAIKQISDAYSELKKQEQLLKSLVEELKKTPKDWAVKMGENLNFDLHKLSEEIGRIHMYTF